MIGACKDVGVKNNFQEPIGSQNEFVPAQTKIKEVLS
jgi:hypothetical protein